MVIGRTLGTEGSFLSALQFPWLMWSFPVFWGLSSIGQLPNPDPSDIAEWDKSDVIKKNKGSRVGWPKNRCRSAAFRLRGSLE
jgi:hypothetical protein